MANRGVKQQNTSARTSLKQHGSEQKGHMEDTAEYGGHGQQAGEHPQTGSPHGDCAGDESE